MTANGWRIPPTSLRHQWFSCSNIMNDITNIDNSQLDAQNPGLRMTACYQPFRALDVLVGCEESQVVMKALRKIGHNAKSCDLQECSGGEPEHHYQMDVFKAIDLQKWDLIILHPPCTAIAVSGNRWYGAGQPRHKERIEAVKFTQKLWDKATSVCKRVALENPVGVLNKIGNFPKPNYVQPWQFGHGETKKTGFWLYGLEPLKPTDIVEGREQKVWQMPPCQDRGKLRSKTYQGIAKALASQYTAFMDSGMTLIDWGMLDISKKNRIFAEYMLLLNNELSYAEKQKIRIEAWRKKQ